MSVVSFNDVTIPAFCFCLSLKLYLNSLVYHRNIFGSSSKVFGNLRQSSDIFGNSQKMFGNVRLAFESILENLRKSSEGGRKSSANHQNRRHQHVYIIQNSLMEWTMSSVRPSNSGCTRIVGRARRRRIATEVLFKLSKCIPNWMYAS